MISIFNRRELLTTYRLDEQDRVRRILSSNNVDHTVKTVNRTSPSLFAAGPRDRMGSAGIQTDAVYAYTIYVKRSDFEKAQHLIR